MQKKCAIIKTLINLNSAGSVPYLEKDPLFLLFQFLQSFIIKLLNPY